MVLAKFVCVGIVCTAWFSLDTDCQANVVSILSLLFWGWILKQLMTNLLQLVLWKFSFKNRKLILGFSLIIFSMLTLKQFLSQALFRMIASWHKVNHAKWKIFSYCGFWHASQRSLFKKPTDKKYGCWEINMDISCS